ncbi:MAG: methionine synthase [Anaerolineae bacterium]|nr:methionine synthase [Anaerolineae bacterium]
MGSLPHTRVPEAWEAVLSRFPVLPGWPQLPRRSYLENMYTQFSEGFPGLVMDENRLYVDRRRGLDRGLERLYLAYLENDLDYGRISPAYAAALGALLRGEVRLPEGILALKGQVTGPVSWGLTIVDHNQRPIIYDEVLEDAVGKHLRMKAAWQERELRKLAPQTIIFVEEPYMASLGSAFVSLSRGQVIELLEEIFAGLEGLKGIHCCGNTNWEIILRTSVDILSLDAYDYGETLLPYARELQDFLMRGGIIAWGIVPAGDAIEGETVESLVQRLAQLLDRLAEAGVSREALLQAGLISPSCGLGALTPSLAERVMDLTVKVAARVQQQYSGE